MGEEIAKIVIIGAGPAGIAAAVEAKAADIDPVIVLEKAKHYCDTVVSLYHKGKRVDPVYRKMKIDPIGIMSFDTESREEFLSRIDSIVKEYSLDIRTGHEVLKVQHSDGLFTTITSSGVKIVSPIVIVAIGVFGKPVRPSYPIPREIRDKVHFRVSKNPPEGLKIMVVGGGDSAAEVACFLSEKNSVTLCYRQEKFFRMNDINLKAINSRVEQGKITLKMPVDIEEIRPSGQKIEVIFKDQPSEEYDSIYYCLGGSTPQGFLEDIGVELDGRLPKVDKFGETNIKGLFLAGDVAAGKGSIMAAFNSARRSIDRIREKYKDLVYN